MCKVTKRLLAVALSAVLCISTVVGSVRLVSAETSTTDNATNVFVNVIYAQTSARSMLELVNDMRTGEDAWAYSSSGEVVCYEDLEELTYDYELEAIAMQRAAELVLAYSHTRTDGTNCFSAYDDAGYTYTSAGENIAAGYTSVESVFIGWSEENEDYSGQGHRRNMLSSDYNRIGIACVEYQGVYYWVQEFAYSNEEITETEANDSETSVGVTIANNQVSDWNVEFSPESYTLVVGDTVALPEITSVAIVTTACWPSGRENIVSVSDTEWTVDEEEGGLSVDNENGTFTTDRAGVSALNVSMFGGLIFLWVTVYNVEFNWNGTECTAVFTNPDYDSADPSSIESVEVACDVEESGKPATCEEDGYVLYTATCTFGDSGKVYSSSWVEEISATGHSWNDLVWDWSEDYSRATLTMTCDYDGSEVLTLNATVTETVLQEQSCLDDGVVEYVATVTVDGVKYTDSVAVTSYATGHDFEITNYVEPTCTEDGYIEETCSICGYVSTTLISSTGHNYEMTEYVEPTCTEEGYAVYTCSECGDSYTQILDAYGHLYEITEIKAQTCTEDGEFLFTCVVCGESHTEVYDAHGHYYEVTDSKDATCTEDGYIIYTCISCEDTYTETISAAGHSIVHVEAKDATETEEGNIEYWYCSECGEYFADENLTETISLADTVIAATGTADNGDTVDNSDSGDISTNDRSDDATGTATESDASDSSDSTSDTGNSSGNGSTATGDVPIYLWIITLFAAAAGIYALTRFRLMGDERI